MNIGQESEGYIKKYFEEKRYIKLVKGGRGKRGFDFRDDESTIFVEVKGTEARRLSHVLFRYFTNAQYEKVKSAFGITRNMKSTWFSESEVSL